MQQIEIPVLTKPKLEDKVKIPQFKNNNRNNPELKTTRGKRPEWLKVQAPGGDSFANIKKMMRSKSLHTVCEEARCPNIGECWGSGTATFMILGDTCTRACSFCAIKTGRPGTLNWEEPNDVARSVKEMQLKHAVVTSVNRDELKDQGSTLWAKTIERIKEEKPDVLNHNIETVPRLYRIVRPQARYQRSLDLLEEAKRLGMRTKTGIMVGIGETDEEVYELMKDLVKIKVNVFTIGQYLQPSVKHSPVDRFVHPDTFKKYKEVGEEMGIEYVESGPLVRSSYHAERHV
jgi:lipoic acid synthetase